jgi:hypothetical protein
MNTSTNTDPRYPIGKYQPQPFSEKLMQEWIRDLALVPSSIEYAILTFDESQLNTPYRDGGWTVKQLIHHVADSHMNGYCRFKLGLTETKPVIKPYDEKAWSVLSDSANLPVNISITLLHSLHLRWNEILMNVKQEQWDRTIIHPEHNTEMSLWYILGSYSWHGRHHVAHIIKLKESKGWQ